jgi:hypothetical protein
VRAAPPATPSGSRAPPLRPREVSGGRSQRKHTHALRAAAPLLCTPVGSQAPGALLWWVHADAAHAPACCRAGSNRDLSYYTWHFW